MDFFFIEYRDPILGLIVLASVVFLVALSSFAWGVFSKAHARADIENFVRKFDSSSDSHADLIASANLSVPNLLALAQVFSKNGDFDKAIGAYLIALPKVANKGEHEFLLTALGKVYLKAGFLKRASEVFLEALKIAPRNAEALSHLTIIYERLKNFARTRETLDALEAQGSDVRQWRAYLGALEILSKEGKFDDKMRQILALSHEFSLLKRMVLEQAINAHEPLDGLNLALQDECVDLAASRPGLLEKLQASKLNAFNLNLLALARQNGLRAKIEFSYFCVNCKNSYPLFFYRCPNCARLGSVKILTKISEENDEESKTF